VDHAFALNLRNGRVHQNAHNGIIDKQSLGRVATFMEDLVDPIEVPSSVRNLDYLDKEFLPR
jgi:hypothetical protein